MWTPLFAILNHYVGNNLGDGNGTPASNANSNNVAWIDGADFSDWDWSPSTILTMVGMAFFEFFGVMCKVVGYQLGEATKVAIMEYLDIVFAFFFQWFLFHRKPNTYEYIGAALLILSCLIQLLEEKFLGAQTPTPVEDDNEIETLIAADGEENKTRRKGFFKKYGTGAGNEDGRWISITDCNPELVESSHAHINFDGAYDVDAYKDVTKHWPRGEDRDTTY